jgi:hypothetical protein
MRVQRDPCVRRRGEDDGERERAEDEYPTDRIVRPPPRDQRTDGGRHGDGSNEEGIQPRGTGAGDVLSCRDAIEDQPRSDQDDCRERKRPGSHTQRDPHTRILVERCTLDHSAGTEPPAVA